MAIARIGPNSIFASANREKIIVEAMLQVGDEQSACNWMRARIRQRFQPSWMAVLASAMAIGTSAPAPKACTTRPAITLFRVGASATATEPATKMPRHSR